MHSIICLSLFLLGGSVSAQNRNSPVPRKGILDLREYTLDKNSIYSLNGEWEFYWERLLTPENYQEVQDREPSIMVSVPSYFSNYRINGKSLPGMGYGTYSLMVILPENYNSSLCFDIPVFDVAFNFYLNDRLIESNGRVGTSPEQEDPMYRPSTFCYIPDGDSLRILIQVSNFHHRRGGFWKTMFMGGAGKLLDRLERQRMYSYSTIGVMFFFMIFFFIFWLFSRRDSMLLLFALTILGMLIRSVNTGLYFSNSFIDTPWSWQIRMEYLGTFLATIFGILFLHQIFPRRYMKPLVLANTIIFSISILGVFILPVHLFTYEIVLFQPLILLFLIHYLSVSLIGAFRRKVTDAIFFVSLAIFICALLNDILLANSTGTSFSNYLSQVAFQLFIFSVAVMIIMQWVHNYNTRLQLESSLHFKNKILSLIAHDLKNPLASVAQFSDLLVEKPELTRKEHILTSLQVSSHAALNLLENLLYWGRSQAHEIEVKPESIHIRKLFEEALSLFEHMAMQKEVDLRIDASQDLIAFGDHTLINIVLRNLISNAIKFTPRKGSITLEGHKEEGKVSVSVIDTGIGIKPEILALFKSEGRLNSSSGTESEPGTGLGLQLARDLISKNGGDLRINSRPNEGSAFTFTLPPGKDK